MNPNQVKVLCLHVVLFFTITYVAVRANAEDTVKLWEISYKKAHSEFMVGNIDASEAAFIESFRLADKLGTNDVHYGQTLEELAKFYTRLQRYPEAEAYLSRLVDVQRGVFGAESIEAAVPSVNLIERQTHTGHTREAEELYEKTFPIIEKRYGASHALVGVLLEARGRMYLLQKNYAEAEIAYTKAFAILDKSETSIDYRVMSSDIFGYSRRQTFPNGFQVIDILDDLGLVYHHQQRWTEAESMLTRALHLNQKFRGPMTFAVAATQTDLAAVYQQQGKWREAEKAARDALKIQKTRRVKTDPEFVNTVQLLASILTAEGKRKEAAELLAK